MKMGVVGCKEKLWKESGNKVVEIQHENELFFNILITELLPSIVLPRVSQEVVTMAMPEIKVEKATPSLEGEGAEHTGLWCLVPGTRDQVLTLLFASWTSGASEFKNLCFISSFKKQNVKACTSREDRVIRMK